MRSNRLVHIGGGAIFALAATLASAVAGEEAAVSPRSVRPGVTQWTLPATPNGLIPTESWHATGSTPAGDIYVGGMDHATNSALYRINQSDGRLSYVGDARSASEEAANWRPGETAQKFHTRPLWHQGRVYVATMDRSTLNEDYRTRRGFHFYAFDPQRSRLLDVSAAEPSGVSAEHGNVVTLASDPTRNQIYAAGVPLGNIYRLDVSTGLTVDLGRPSGYSQQYVYTGRVMWVDGQGRLYFAVGSVDGQASETTHVHYYDPRTGFGELPDWRLQGRHGLETGQCFVDDRICYFADDEGHFYEFNEAGPSWRYLGRLGERKTDNTFFWVLAVTADRNKAYAISSQWGAEGVLYSFDIGSLKSTRVAAMADLSPELKPKAFHTGYAAWDAKGGFYFTSFGGDKKEPVVVTRVAPAELGSLGR
jgi:outer membrane protein assembly factor BamB